MSFKSLSLLPEEFAAYEVWTVRIALFLATITIGPWFALIFYDFLRYIVRMILYELPVVGGKARGRQKPRAPSLSERPGGQRLSFSFGAQPPEKTASSATGVSKSAPTGQTHNRRQS